MKKTKPGKPRKPGAVTKISGAPKNVDEYLAGIPETARSAFDKLRAAVQSAVPPTASEIISYRIPAFKDDGILVWFAAFANHCSLFPTAAVIEKFKSELKNFSTSKGTIHFSTDKPVPTALIKKIVKERVAQHKSKKQK